MRSINKEGLRPTGRPQTHALPRANWFEDDGRVSPRERMRRKAAGMNRTQEQLLHRVEQFQAEPGRSLKGDVQAFPLIVKCLHVALQRFAQFSLELLDAVKQLLLRVVHAGSLSAHSFPWKNAPVILKPVSTEWRALLRRPVGRNPSLLLIGRICRSTVHKPNRELTAPAKAIALHGVASILLMRNWREANGHRQNDEKTSIR